MRKEFREAAAQARRDAEITLKLGVVTALGLFCAGVVYGLAESKITPSPKQPACHLKCQPDTFNF